MIAVGRDLFHTSRRFLLLGMVLYGKIYIEMFQVSQGSSSAVIVDYLTSSEANILLNLHYDFIFHWLCLAFYYHIFNMIRILLAVPMELWSDSLSNPHCFRAAEGFFKFSKLSLINWYIFNCFFIPMKVDATSPEELRWLVQFWFTQSKSWEIHFSLVGPRMVPRKTFVSVSIQEIEQFLMPTRW